MFAELKLELSELELAKSEPAWRPACQMIISPEDPLAWWTGDVY